MAEQTAALLHGKTVLVMGVANRWSLAYAIAQSLHRAGASLVLTYQAERVKKAVEDAARELGSARVFPCDVAQDESVAALFSQLDAEGTVLHGVVHSIAFA